MIRVTTLVEAELSTGVWTDITPDVVDEIDIRYGISGKGPLDNTSSTGICEFSLLNHPTRKYSLFHADKLDGWDVGTAIRIELKDGTDDTPLSVTSLSRILGNVTVTVTNTAVAGNWVTIAGADQSEYNGTFPIFQAGPTFIQYRITGSPTSPATGTITATVHRIKHYGKVSVVTPVTGEYRERIVRVTSHDPVRDLAEHTIRDLAVQTTEDDTQLIREIMTNLPATVAPPDYDTGSQDRTFPIALHDLGEGIKALTLLHDVATSIYGLIVMTGGGVLRHYGKTDRIAAASLFDFDGTTMEELEVTSDVAVLLNKVRVKIRPTTTDPTPASTILWQSTGDPVEVLDDETVELWVEYRDEDDTQDALLGAIGILDSADSSQSVISLTRSGSTATATVTAHGYQNNDWVVIAGANETEYNGAFHITNVTANTFDYTVSGSPATPATGTITAVRTHFAANSASDGTGTDHTTGNVDVTYTSYASSTKIAITNTTGATVYMVDTNGDNWLRVIGRAISDLGPQTFESAVEKPYGTKEITIELRWETDGEYAQDYADNIAAVYSQLTNQVDRLGFNANFSQDLMTQALRREPGDLITITEVVSGLTMQSTVIHGVNLRVSPGGLLHCEFGLAPASTPFDAWLLEVVGRGELEVNTKLGL